MNEARIEVQTTKTRLRWWRRRWIVWTGVAFVLVAVVGAGIVMWGLRQMQPMLRKKVVETLSARFHSPVELDRLEVSMRRGVIVTGGGLRILYLAGPTKPDARPNAPPMLAVDSFEFRTGWRELLRPTTRVVAVKVRGLQVNIPPKGERGEGMPDDPKRKRQSILGIAVDTIECTDAKVVIETSKAGDNKTGKKPLEFDIGRLVLTDVGARKPLNYDAVLKNPKPIGDVHSTGHFGPWQDDNPRDTPLDGSYEFTHADLSSIHGISGILSSTGKFGGTLGEIAVEGVTETPDFRLDVSEHALPLHTEFKAVVDGTTGDTRLDEVKARVGQSELTASGAVTRGVGAPGHDTDLHVVMEKGRIEDMLTLGMKAKPALMRGALALKMHVEIPPGAVSVSRKMRLAGTFAIHDAFLNDAKMQQQLDAMSERAKGKPHLANAQDAEVVGSTVSGKFSQADAVLDVSELNFAMPGAQVAMSGQVHLVGSRFEFHGKVRTEATASQMTTGWKSLLLMPFDKLLKKNGAGVELPIKVTGTGSTYDLRLDLAHDTRAPAGRASTPQ
ncbi:MAG: AsmA-like C-terminal region-containing protein [Edaphobacter sp.]